MATEVYLFLPEPASATQIREAYPYGPSPSAFHTDMGIEIDPGVATDNPVLAVVTGMVRCIPDSSLTTCCLILSPLPVQLHDINEAVGPCVVFFIYRNLDLNSMAERFAPRIEQAQKTPAFQGDEASASSPLSDFIDGKFSVFVDGGEELAHASTNGGEGGWARLGFEIVYMPSIKFEGNGFQRIKDLIKPEATTRRLDPMCFYARVANSYSALRLAPGHAHHTLLTLPTRRTLLELRDEYDYPSDLEIDVWDSAKGATTQFEFDPDQHGTVVLDTAPSGASASATGYTVSKPDYHFTVLPSGEGAFQFQSCSLTAPAHWALQAIYMPPGDSVEEEPDSWFVANTPVTTTPPLPRYTSGNRITPIRDGEAVFGACARALGLSAQLKEECDFISIDFILFANWWFDDSFQLIHGNPDSTLAALTTAAATTGAQVRALLFKQLIDFQTLIVKNSAEVDRINGLPGGRGKAILDDETASKGSHHQKFMVVKGKTEAGKDRAVAFCGGVDFNSNRRDSPAHLAFGGYHDIHAKVQGPAVADIFQSFQDRWDIHLVPFSLTLDSSSVPPEGKTFVQVARTYPRTKEYPFAPNGSFTPLKAFLRAIEKAKKFIYIEDQYLTPYSGGNPATAEDDSLEVLKALKEALARIDYLLIVIPNNTEMAWLKKLLAVVTPGEAAEWLPGQARFRRQMFISGLKSNQETRHKVHVFYLHRNRWHTEATSISLGEATEGDSMLSSGGLAHRDEIYCHSKVWIVDDIIAKIGSANCNRRSYTHDSEMDLVMVDGALDNGARALARKLRVDLWAEHLGMNWPRSALLEDHLHALDYWRGPQLPNSHVYKYKEGEGVNYNWENNVGWDFIIDPDGTGEGD